MRRGAIEAIFTARSCQQLDVADHIHDDDDEDDDEEEDHDDDDEAHDDDGKIFF